MDRTVSAFLSADSDSLLIYFESLHSLVIGLFSLWATVTSPLLAGRRRSPTGDINQMSLFIGGGGNPAALFCVGLVLPSWAWAVGLNSSRRGRSRGRPRSHQLRSLPALEFRRGRRCLGAKGLR